MEKNVIEKEAPFLRILQENPEIAENIAKLVATPALNSAYQAINNLYNEIIELQKDLKDKNDEISRMHLDIERLSSKLGYDKITY